MSAAQPKYIFLDQNHWIYLAKAVHGNPHRPEHVEVAARLLRLVDRGEICLPLTTTHLIEHLKAADPGRRARLAEVFDRFSRTWFIAAWGAIVKDEFSRAVAATFSGDPPPERLPVIGRGFLFGLSPRMRELVSSQLRILSLEEITSIAALPGALLDLLSFENETGRTQQNIVMIDVGRQYAQDAETLRAVRRSAGRAVLRRAQYARYTYDFQAEIRAALAAKGKTFDEFAALGPIGLTEFWDRVPSFRVDADLTLYRDRQWSRAVQANDLGDISHLVVAVPYCDVVVVERFWARAIEETALATEYATTVCTDIVDLDALLPD